MAASLQKINYTRLNIGTITFLAALTITLTGPIGLLILAVSTSIGMLAPLLGVKRSNSMGVLMLPLIILYSSI